MQNETCAVRALLSASEVVVFTGAGISAESGIATYREPLTGIWAQHDPQTLETANAFRANPPLVWRWYLWRRQQVTNASSIQRWVGPSAGRGKT